MLEHIVPSQREQLKKDDSAQKRAQSGHRPLLMCVSSVIPVLCTQQQCVAVQSVLFVLAVAAAL